MERKIGEIFLYDGEWYQCVEEDGCAKCDLRNKICTRDTSINTFKSCDRNFRSDGRSVIFRELEKVGEPYYDKNCSQVLQRYNYYVPTITFDLRVHVLGNNVVGIENEQSKENMEEKDVIKIKQTPLQLLVERYNKGLSYSDFEEEVKKLYANNHIEENHLKPFDLEAAKAGNPVCTRDGRKARIICFDKKGDHPIIALIEDKKGEEVVSEEINFYFINGRAINEKIESNDDLMMLPEKKEGWVNIYRGQVYNTLERAKKAVDHNDNYLKTIKIDWEE